MLHEVHEKSSIDDQDDHEIMCVDLGPSWMDPIVTYLEHDRLPEDEKEAKKLRLKAAQFWLSPDKKLYRKSFTGP